MNYMADKYPLLLRTNDDFTHAVTDIGYDITPFSPKFVIKNKDGTLIDWSAYIVKTSTTSFIINVKASIVTAVGSMVASYDCVIDMGGGSKDMLFGGAITIVEGIS